jgi:hypothetical protein
MTSQEIALRQRAAVESHIFGVLKRSIFGRFEKRCPYYFSGQNVIQI